MAENKARHGIRRPSHGLRGLDGTSVRRFVVYALVCCMVAAVVEWYVLPLARWGEPAENRLISPPSVLHFLSLLLPLLALWITRPASFVWRTKVRDLHGGGRALFRCACAVFLCAALLWAFVFWFFGPFRDAPREIWYNDQYSHYFDPNQYALAADGVLHGRLWLDLPVSDALASLDDPYDVASRMAISSESTPVFWDHAFFEGRYYMYFGILPALVLFVPYQALTGGQLPTTVAVFVLAVAVIAVIPWLTSNVARRMGRSVSVGMYFVMCLALLLGSNVLYAVQLADFYVLPQVASLLCTFTALSLWFGAERGDGSLSGGRICFGSVAMALNIMCRPPFIVFALIAVPLFWNQIRRRSLLSLRGWRLSLAALLPFLVVGGVQCAYNYARFGSIAEFGLRYNLTGSSAGSVTKAPLTLYGSFLQLFQPPSFVASFPFLGSNDTLTTIAHEAGVGGYFAILPFALCVLMIPFARRRLGKDRLYWVQVVCVVLAFVLAVLEVRTAGVGRRYQIDFGWAFALAAGLFVWTMDGLLCEAGTTLEDRSAGLDMIRSFLIWFCVLTLLAAMLISFFGGFSDGRLSSGDPSLFSIVREWFGILREPIPNGLT